MDCLAFFVHGHSLIVLGYITEPKSNPGKKRPCLLSLSLQKQAGLALTSLSLHPNDSVLLISVLTL